MRIARATVENQLVEALARRFQKPHAVEPEEFDRWDDDYAAEMRRVHRNYPDDHDVMALFVEALITRTPRRLWNVKTGAPARGSDVLEAVQVCERSIAHGGTARRNHSTQQSCICIFMPWKWRTIRKRQWRSADELAPMCPDAGHMNHMPGHIYVLCGEYEKARLASERRCAPTTCISPISGPFSYYTVACCHDLHLMMHTCMFLGRYADAVAAANKMCGLLTKEVLSVKDRPKFTMSLEGYYSMKAHVSVRFGRWQEIIDEPLPDDPELYLVTTAMHHYAKGVAHASLKNFREADAERTASTKACDRIPRHRQFFNNMAHDMLGGGREDDGRGAAISQGQPRGGFRTFAGKRPPGRQPSVHRAVGMDAPAAPRAGGAPVGAGSLRRGRADLSRRSRPERQDPAVRAASRQRLGAAWAGGMSAKAWWRAKSWRRCRRS